MGVLLIDVGDFVVLYYVMWDVDVGVMNVKYVKEVEEVMWSFVDVVLIVFVEGMILFVFGGDYFIVIGLLVGSVCDVDIGVIWFDVYGDFNMLSILLFGNVYGMLLVVVFGIGDFVGVEWVNVVGFKEENVVIVGLCFVDDVEVEVICDSDVMVYMMLDIDECGIIDVMNDVFDVVIDGIDGVYISFDFDWFDFCEVFGVGMFVCGGVIYCEVYVVMEFVVCLEVMCLFEFVEVNFIFDEYNEIVMFVIEFVVSVFGKCIF